MRVLPAVESLARDLRQAGKPAGYVCIAPVIAARLFGGEGVKLTIGNDRDTAEAMESWGARHVDCTVEEIAVDERLEDRLHPGLHARSVDCPGGGRHRQARLGGPGDGLAPTERRDGTRD